MFSRNIYLEKLIKLRETAPIKVITGVRRCGKSTLLDLFEEHLLKSKFPRRYIIRVNFEMDEFSGIRDNRSLSLYLKARIDASGVPARGRKIIVMLDEVQLIPGWEKTVNSLRAGKRVDLYITGSNAFLLSSELATLLSGRYMEIHMLPLSFREYLEFNGYKPGDNPDAWFSNFVAYGGFPGLHEMRQNEDMIRSFLSGVYNTILMKDVISRTALRDTELLEKVVRFAAGTIGNLITTKRVSDYLTSAGRKTAHETIDAYLHSLEKAFFLYRSPRFDIKGKELLKTQGKYYLVDTGLRYWSLGKKSADMGSILENIVYLELIRRGFQVFTGRLPKQKNAAEDREVDFIALKDGITRYIQVTQSLQEQTVLDRELKPLKAIKDNYEKTVLSMDRTPFTDHEGITQRNIVDWLVE
jgi:predicted AAA+ superfamily ATPase